MFLTNTMYSPSAHITAANLAQFQKEAFSPYASSSIKGKKVQLGVTGEGKYVVITSSFNEETCILWFIKLTDAINKYESYLI